MLKKKDDSAASLAAEVTAAQVAYQQIREDVLARRQARLAAVNETIDDLEAEAVALEAIA